jgi:hypothetical protein
MPRADKMPVPYLEVQDPKIMMSGKGAPRSTVFGVLGRTPKGEEHVGVKTLGGLIKSTTAGGKNMPGTFMTERDALRIPGQTDRMILGKAAKTHIPGVHMGQVPYAGYYMSAVGKAL